MDGYRKLGLSDIPDALTPAQHKRELDEAVGASTFGCNFFEAEPGEILPWGFHRHPDQEELFFVLEGELTVETPDDEIVLGPEELLFVPEDHPNMARASGDGRTRVLAVGAPKDGDRAVLEEECPDCGTVERLDTAVHERDEDGTTTRVAVVSCSACGTEIRRF
jgi:uncharacterized cupin superfamily protein